MIWFVVLVTVMLNGDVFTEVRHATVPKNNNKESCEMAGKFIADQELEKIGSENGRVFYTCQFFKIEDIDKVLERTSL